MIRAKRHWDVSPVNCGFEVGRRVAKQLRCCTVSVAGLGCFATTEEKGEAAQSRDLGAGSGVQRRAIEVRRRTVANAARPMNVISAVPLDAMSFVNGAVLQP